MKTSDKILLFSTFGAFGLFIVSDLLHYFSYRSGDVLRFQDIEHLDFTPHVVEGVHWLVLDGPMQTTFYPADRLRVDVDKEAEPKISYERQGDTMFVRCREHNARSAHDQVPSYEGYVPVHVFCPALKGIRIKNGFATLDNEEGHRAMNVSLQLINTQLWVGSFSIGSTTTVEPWDTISVRGSNCEVALNFQAHVKMIDLRVDGNSVVWDHMSLVDSGYIHSDPGTLLHLQGRNVKKIRLDALTLSAP
jgi:hypothetical protein